METGGHTVQVRAMCSSLSKRNAAALYTAESGSSSVGAQRSEEIQGDVRVCLAALPVPAVAALRTELV
eukprot:CAMPEP_0119172934 /NCGR_PEP_ID=MMETSP1315-20130426/30723_1 /TAXON_ID=676789 /ORGANISM="Prasinoderma singularis, Strain RCC927" /LENGTH=67 /DNA_ID=CAMNT_0007166847 /DNA_START=36 /DNA_END=234 /DNA_ORIENTATION=-